jgi:hypothetical protein
MKNICMILAVVAVMMAMSVMTGCKQQSKPAEAKPAVEAAAPAETKTVSEEPAKPAEAPADQKPKDHPAH